MTGQANYPTSLDDDTSLHDVTDNVTSVIAAHHNNIKEAVKAIEARIGIRNTAVSTSLDYRLGHPTFGHRHDAASGQGPIFPASAFLMPASGLPSGGVNMIDHVVSTAIHGPIRATGIASVINSMGVWVPSQVERTSVQLFLNGSAIVGSKVTHPVILHRTLQLETTQGGLRVGPSGATTAFILRFGASAVYGASVGNGIRFAPGATAFRQSAAGTPNVITYPSGAVITLDTEAVGSNDPGQDLSINLSFRE